MARTVTLAQLRLRSQQRADMVNSNFVSLAEWNGLISDSATELYDLLTTVFEDYYFQTYTITTDGVNDTYPLPGDFYKLLGVDQVVSGTSGASRSLLPYNFAERNAYKPFRDANITLHLPYVPSMPALINDSDTFDGINGWEEYIVVDAARKALQKEESDTSDCKQDKANLIKRINDSAPNRDAGQGERVTDISAIDPFDVLYFPSTIHYRILGSNLKLVSSYSAGIAHA